MIEKKYFVIGAIVSYVFLTVWFLTVYEKQFIEPCLKNQTCVRFCCNDKSFCEESYVRKNFNANLLTYYPKEDKELIILHGKPKCSVIKVAEEEGTRLWSLGLVSFS